MVVVSADGTRDRQWRQGDSRTREITDALVPEEVVAFESGDLAYTVGYERGEVVVDSGEKRTVTFRVT